MSLPIIGGCSFSRGEFVAGIGFVDEDGRPDEEKQAAWLAFLAERRHARGDHELCSPDHGPRYCFAAKMRYLRSAPGGLAAYMG